MSPKVFTKHFQLKILFVVTFKWNFIFLLLIVTTNGAYAILKEDKVEN